MQYILRFSKPSCNPCAILKQAMATQVLPPEVELIDIDVTKPMATMPTDLFKHDLAEVPSLISKYTIRSVPTLVVVDGLGKEVQTRLLGQVTTKEYGSWLRAWESW